MGDSTVAVVSGDGISLQFQTQQSIIDLCSQVCLTLLQSQGGRAWSHGLLLNAPQCETIQKKSKEKELEGMTKTNHHNKVALLLKFTTLIFRLQMNKQNPN